MEIGKLLLKAIYSNSWLKIEYSKEDEVTNFMIGINKIDLGKKLLICDVFNITKNRDAQPDYMIYWEKITEAEVCEGTYHKSPENLIEFLDNCDNLFVLNNRSYTNDDLIDYYIDCFKLDTVPFITKYSLIDNIDDDVLLKDNKYKLNDDQFDFLYKENFFKK